MKSTLFVTEMVYRLLMQSPVGPKIGGRIFRDLRPVDSVRPDVVIRCDNITQENPQMALVTVNVHAPDLHFMLGGEHYDAPDYTLLGEVSDIASEALDDVCVSGCYLCVEGTALKAETDGHMISISVNVTIHNV